MISFLFSLDLKQNRPLFAFLKSKMCRRGDIYTTALISVC